MRILTSDCESSYLSTVRQVQVPAYMETFPGNVCGGQGVSFSDILLSLQNNNVVEYQSSDPCVCVWQPHYDQIIIGGA